MVDIVALFEEKSGRKANPEFLQALNQGLSPRQDWNTILEEMDLKKQLQQVSFGYWVLDKSTNKLAACPC